jgi:hypothetical protein
MTDVTQGADALDDAALFREAADADAKTLADFENPKFEPPVEKPADKPVDKVDDKTIKTEPKEPPKEEPPIPAGRLREESEARRRAERERDEIAARLAAFQRQPPPQQQTPPKKPDVFENPEAFVMSLVTPLLEAQEQQRRIENENRSQDRAVERFGPEMVVQSRQALEQGMKLGDPMAWAVYNQAMKSHDPYGVIAGWHYERAMLHHIGGDLNAFRKREREEALKDPEYLKQALELAKGTAKNNGSFRNEPPVKSPVPNMPSLGNIGAGGGDTQVTEPSDIELFRAATSAKRR